MSYFPHDIQPDAMDCGPTCLRIIARYYGKAYSITYLRQLCHSTRSGSSFLGLSNAAEALGFRTMAVKISFARMQKEAPLPAIIHWNQNHFVVVYKITGSRVFISDPGTGLVNYSHKEFIRYWMGRDSSNDLQEGIMLLLETTPSFSETRTHGVEKKKMQIMSFLMHYFRPHRKFIFQVLLSLLAGSLLSLLFPVLTQSVIDVGIAGNNISFIWLVLIAQLALTLGQLGLDIIRTWTLLHISKRISISLISDFFVKLMKLPIRFFDTKLTGDLMQRISDHGRIQSFLTNTTLTTVFSLFTAVLYGCMLIYYSFTLFAVSIAGAFLYLGWIFFFQHRRKVLDYKRFHQSAETNSKIYEIINGMQELKLHNAEQQKRWEWERIQVKLYRISIEALSLEQTQGIGSRIINEVKNIFITIIAAKLVIDGQLTLGMMIAVSYIIGQLNAPLLQLINIVRSWQDARISLNRLSEIYSREDEVTIAAEGEATIITPVPTDHAMRLENLSFRYDELAEDVLKNINITIPSHKVTAIVGSSGSGKTTLLKLLMRYYQPTKGKITVGQNYNLATIDIRGWRSKCGVVMQEGFIFNDSIAGNIAVGEDIPDIQRVQYAAGLANIKSFIEELPRGYQTKIGPEGLGISTGQKQRILIARAVYKDPEILFFDEATSSLDANNEKQIMENLDSFYNGKTVVVIAHRLSTVRNADKIIVFENGAIVEEGNHKSLVENEGYYFNLIKNQLQLNP